MTFSTMKRGARTVLTCLTLIGLSGAAAGLPATVLTNAGQVAEGSLSGIAPVVRLTTPYEASFIGPASQFDVASSSIRQITIDFPRVIVEAERLALIGPFSAFSGLNEALVLDRPGEESLLLATASLRAIALNGNAFRPVPREWLGDRYLTTPAVVPSSSVGAREAEWSTLPPTSAEQELVPIWNALTPTLPPAEEPAEIPWWLGLLAVAAAAALVLLSTGAGSA